MHTIPRSARAWTTTPKSIFVIRHNRQTALNQRRVSYVMTPYPPPVFLPSPHLLSPYPYNAPGRTLNEATQYSMSSTIVITIMAACLNTLATPVIGRLSLHNIKNIAHFQIRLHRILHIISMVPSLPVSNFSTPSFASRILYGPPTIPKTRA